MTVGILLGLIKDLAEYLYIRLRVSIRGALIWGCSGSVNEQNEFIAAHYPLEYKRMLDIRSKYSK